MSDALHPPTAPSVAALTRYSILGQVEALVLRGCKPSAAAYEVAAREHVDASGRVVRVSARTIQRWRRAYIAEGLSALESKRPQRTEGSTVLSAKFLAFLAAEKERDPRASVPELMRRARVRGILAQDLPVNRATVWRACRRMGLETRARPTRREADTRRWRYPHRMQCILSDGKHFRAGAARLKRVALFFLDDATRYGLDVIVGPSESTELFLRGLYELVRKHGLPDLVYLDHGPGFISDDTFAVVQALGAWLVHGRVRYPEGHGAIERFNRTAYEQVLRSLDGAAEVDPDPDALTLRLRHLLGRYNDTPHETLGGDPPRQHWEAGRALRFPEDEADLYRRFVVREPRKVSSDHVLKVDGRLWEAPRGLAERRIEVIRHVLDDRFWVVHEGRVVELAELDPHQNATERRGASASVRPVASEGVPDTAATLAYRQDFLPLTDAEGAYHRADDPPTVRPAAEEEETPP